MDEKRTFTNRDQLLGICQVFEIGMPYEERWSKADAFEGRCTSDRVGQPKVEYQTETADNPIELDVPNTVLVEAARRGIPLDNPIKMGFLALELGGEEFMRRNASIYNTLIAIQKERDKEAAATAVDIDKLTIRRMRAMQADELSAALLQFVATIPGDDYKAILRRFLDLDDAELQAQLEDAL